MRNVVYHVEAHWATATATATVAAAAADETVAGNITHREKEGKKRGERGEKSIPRRATLCRSLVEQQTTAAALATEFRLAFSKDHNTDTQVCCKTLSICSVRCRSKENRVEELDKESCLMTLERAIGYDGLGLLICWYRSNI